MDGWLMDGLFALRLQVFLPQWLWSLHAPTTFVSWHCSTYCKWLRGSRGKFVISSQDQFEEQNMLQEQFAFRLRGSGPSTGLAVNAKNHFWKEIEMTFKVMENAWLCTCFPVVWIFHIQCSSIVTPLLVLVPHATSNQMLISGNASTWSMVYKRCGQRAWKDWVRWLRCHCVPSELLVVLQESWSCMVSCVANQSASLCTY